MEITCDIAMDLVDIYTSGAASEDTERAVQEHLQSCKECSSFYDGYKKELEEEKNSNSSNQKFTYQASPYLADDILSDSLKTLSRRLRKRRIISNTIGIITVVMGVVFAIGECIETIKGKD